MPTAATATLCLDPRSKAGTIRFLSGESHACLPGLHGIRRGPVAPGHGTAVNRAASARGLRSAACRVRCADSHLYGLDWASASNDRSERCFCVSADPLTMTADPPWPPPVD